MNFTNYLNILGDHPLIVKGEIGSLEALLSIPKSCSTRYAALIGHPHSLQGGTMNNKVVTTLARVFKELNVPSLRFNFRGVGASEGVYDHGVGESKDMLILAQQWQEQNPDIHLIFSGFSFGSYVAYRTAASCPQSSLITIAPPVHHYDYHEFKPDLSSWLIVQGDEDEVVPYSLVEQFAKQATPPIPMVTFTGTSHFFHGKLIELKSQLIDYLISKVHAV
jgi:alpha/beta superfamily hydrolase